jgi:HSP20 family protein
MKNSYPICGTGVCGTQDDLNSIFRSLFGEMIPAKDGGIAQYRQPIAEVYETDKELVAELEMPGVSKDDIKVNVKDGVLEIKAEKKQEKEEKKKDSYRYERSYAGFHRYIQLPEGVDGKQIRGTYEAGVLRLEIPKPKEQKALGYEVKIN